MGKKGKTEDGTEVGLGEGVKKNPTQNMAIFMWDSF